MPTTMPPTIREMTRDEAQAMLRGHHVGRIAYAFHDQVDIEPIHYVYDAGAIYLRTSPGSKLLTLRHNPWVAFEVDEVHGRHAWRSVVAHGTVYELRPTGTPADHRAYERALLLLREQDPEALTPADPAPWRTVLVQLAVDRLRGRVAHAAERAASA
jgi:nitroimidazol reductase NimA-like FMN-containing flavoprotein (pyridoxamine 5'-phosphate oxidase superfamily)